MGGASGRIAVYSIVGTIPWIFIREGGLKRIFCIKNSAGVIAGINWPKTNFEGIAVLSPSYDCFCPILAFC